ncbi:MAG: malto-oligosyltrehalose synthase [Parachlamydiaceae bacterium]
MNKCYPRATYRVQFNKNFTFKQAIELVDYWRELGISHLYASPILKARQGSLHGYDTVDPEQINPDIGSEEDFLLLAKRLQESNMHILLDIVPNHMCISQAENKWWFDILEKGPTSIYADYFDIQWPSIKSINDQKIILPVLDQLYGKALESKKIQVRYHDGTFYIALYQYELPTNIKSWPMILSPILASLQQSSPDDKILISELKNLIDNAEQVNDSQLIKKRLEQIRQFYPPFAKLLEEQLDAVNGQKGVASSFEALESFLDRQFYRLCFWRVANEEINFRRFFDIIEYAGIRTELPKVYLATHKKMIELVKQGYVSGLRIDHIDGLWDPKNYLLQLQQSLGTSNYVIAEKILTGDESLRKDWPLEGTVGYDYMNYINGLFIDSSRKQEFWDIYQKFTGVSTNVADLYYECKKLILDASLSSELYMLAHLLETIASRHRSSKDFTSKNLISALRAIIACFPVYRSYIQAQKHEVHEDDRLVIKTALRRARKRHSTIHDAVYDFIEEVLFLKHPEDLEEQWVEERGNFVMRFQQLTGPTMAKGIEDTAFYRFFPLSSLNEVGNELHRFGTSIEEFHKMNQTTMEKWPHTLLASTTHDTKRSEDVRARMNVLSELPSQWLEKLEEWQAMNASLKEEHHEELVPNCNEEYLLYQTLFGSWPLHEMDEKALLIYKERIKGYMEKAVREAKINSSWINPQPLYEQKIFKFLDKILKPNSLFLKSFTRFATPLFDFGLLNSLAQALLKCSSPGAPDIYQGNEIWDFSLVDPDNRRPVDYLLRRQMLKDLPPLREMLQSPHDGRVKMFLIKKLLEFRKDNSLLFERGEYIPLNVKGPMARYVVAFMRKYENQSLIVITGRFFSHSMQNFNTQTPGDIWANTAVELTQYQENKTFYHLLFNETFTSLDLSALFSHLPLAVLQTL